MAGQVDHAVGGETSVSRAHGNSAHESRRASHHVHQRRPGKVLEAVGSQPAIASPAPVDHNRVDEGSDHAGVDEVCVEGAALRHGARHDSGGSGGEGPLEQPVGVRGAASHDVPGGADEAAGARAVGQRVANDVPDEGAQASVHHILDKDVLGVLGSHAASLEEGETGLHEEHEDGAEQQPENVGVGGEVTGIRIARHGD
mmetsp:Transcript_10538/g.30002  ORF Transcript_10538/g.30002 Transcript_10538/m.30002 type:complete len:200 (+) Transcript_10538:935-1534(+)